MKRLQFYLYKSEGRKGFRQDLSLSCALKIIVSPMSPYAIQRRKVADVAHISP